MEHISITTKETYSEDLNRNWSLDFLTENSIVAILECLNDLKKKRLKETNKIMPVLKDITKSEKKNRIELEQFKRDAKRNLYCAYDGDGYYGTETQISETPVCFYEINHNETPDWATHVYWFNK